ncbi:hypothetical protein Tco_0555816 [Tanacetum coccineum]
MGQMDGVLGGGLHSLTMADENINAPEVPVAAASPPTRSDEQILPRNKWVPMGKSNYFLDVERTQANPIFKIAIDILKNTFLKAFHASHHSIHLHPANLSGVVTNDMYQPWRALATIINLCLTGKTSAFERPRAPVLQILWGVVNKANIDYAERIWEEFTQAYTSSTKDQVLHQLPYEESALGYLKFSFKNTKRVRFGMAILDTLISENIRSATYYPEYVAKVAKYQRYLAGEVVSDDEAPAPKPANGAKSKTPRKPKPQSTSSQPPKPKPAPAKPQEKKRKLAMDATEAPSLAKRLKAGKVVNKRTLKSSQQLVDELVDKGVPADEPRFEDEEADIMQKLMEESLKDSYLAPRGLIPPMVIREPEPGKFQPLPEVQERGKRSRLQRKRTLLNSSSFRGALLPQEPSGLVETSSLYAELGLTVSEMDSDEEVSPETNEEDQEEGQGGTNPGDVGVSQTPSSHVVYAGPNLDHMDLGIAEASSQPNTKQMDEEFTVTAYPKVQENLKLPTEGDVRLEDPTSSAATLSSLQNLDKEISFTNQSLTSSTGRRT